MSAVLGIETSCDETSASVVRNGAEVLSNVVSSQVSQHRPFGGVVPELASRKHLEAIIPVVREALDGAGAKPDEMDAIAVTQGPGLLGCLMIGLTAAKALSVALGKPLVAVNHLHAHAASAAIEGGIETPFIALVVSGGHTTLFLAKTLTEFEVLAATRDDAAGEAFDKGAKALGLGYPGGAEIDRLAKGGDPGKFRFPRPLADTGEMWFSFSGLKTSLAYGIEKNGPPSPEDLPDICAGYQEAIVDSLIEKSLLAVRKTGVKNFAVTGGVACNSRLREKADGAFKKENVRLTIPRPSLCTDNAAMIASLGFHLFKEGRTAPPDVAAFSTSRLKINRGGTRF